jgi:hypothetical protein
MTRYPNKNARLFMRCLDMAKHSALAAPNQTKEE